MTCWRLVFLCEIASSLLRCWMSYSVMGEPFAITTTCASAVPGVTRARPTKAPMSHRPHAEHLMFIGWTLDASMVIAYAVYGLNIAWGGQRPGSQTCRPAFAISAAA